LGRSSAGYDELIKRYLEEEAEAKEIRRRYADWDFIRRQPPRVRAALEYYVETGDIRRACLIAGMDLEDFRELLRKANVPVVV
jgi:hypothetical protein